MSTIRAAFFCASLLASPTLTANGDSGLADVLRGAKARDYLAVLEQISQLDRRGGQSDVALVQLLDYYLGEGPQVLLEEAITRRGKRMLPLLAGASAKRANCMAPFEELCISQSGEGGQLRTARFARLEKAIKKGIVLCSELDKCPRVDRN